MTSNTTTKKLTVKIDNKYYKVKVNVTHDMNGIVTGMNPEFEDVKSISEKTGYSSVDILEKVNKQINSHFRIKA